MKNFIKSTIIAQSLFLAQASICMQQAPTPPGENDHISGFGTLLAPLPDNDPSITPLHRAAATGDVDLVRQLLSTGALTNPQTRIGETPLHYAARGGHVEVAQILLESQLPPQGATANDLHNAHQNAINESPMHVATLHDQLAFVRYLIGADVHTDGRTNNAHLPLHYAAYVGTEKSAQMGEAFKRTGIDIYATDLQANTPLHIAAYYGREPFVSFLLNHHAPVYLRNRQGQTALHLAAIRGHQDIVRLLLQRQQDVDIRTIHEVAYGAHLERPRMRDILNMLLTRSQEPNRNIGTQLQVEAVPGQTLPNIEIILRHNGPEPFIIPITGAMYETPAPTMQRLFATVAQTAATTEGFAALRPILNALMYFILSMNTISQMQARKS